MSPIRNDVYLKIAILALVASSAALTGCGTGNQAVKPAVVPTTSSLINNPVNPALVPQSMIGLNDIGSFTQPQQAQINALLGNYTGTFDGDDVNGNPVTQSYTLTLGKGTSASVPGKTFVQATFNAGPMSFSSLMQTTYQAAVAGDTGPTLVFVSVPTNVTYNPSPVVLDIELTLNGSNQFDPTQSMNNNGGYGPIRILDSASLQDVVYFNDDFLRH
jgi:hypothetical protein